MLDSTRFLTASSLDGGGAPLSTYDQDIGLTYSGKDPNKPNMISNLKEIEDKGKENRSSKASDYPNKKNK